MTTTIYRAVLNQAFGSTSSGGAPNVDFLSDTINIALVTSSYTPNADTHDFWDDVVANETSGTGYTANGATLGSKTLTYTAANSWSPAWVAATAYTLNAIVRPTSGNGFLYQAVVAGTSHATTEPTWPTVLGTTVVDQGVTWLCAGRGINVFDAADPSWASSSVTARYGVVYDRTPASDATRPLICYLDFGSNQTTSNGTFAITFPSTGLFYILA
jgi:hypothetical protein